MRRLVVFIILGLSYCVSTGTQAGFDHDSTRWQIEQTSLQFFIDNANPTSGLVRDSSENFAPNPASNTVASVSSTGFGMAVVTNAALRGMVTQAFAENYVLRALKFTRDHVARRKGWLLHWVDWSTGARVWDCEYSTIDTALFMAGALYAAEAFPNTELASIAHQMYLDLDFLDFLTDGGTKPDKRTLTMAYYDGVGYTSAQWNMYAEEMLLLILGLGHPTHPLPADVWTAWSRWPSGGPAAVQGFMGLDEPLFVHQYSHLYIDFRQFNDRYPNYYDNSVDVTEYQRNQRNGPQTYKTLAAGFWGFSAGDGPNNTYKVYTALNHSSTVCIGCVVGASMFKPDEILDDVSTWLQGPYKTQIWGKYGLTDSIDIDQNWFSSEVLGITVGPEFLSLANSNDNTSVWKTFMNIPEIRIGLDVAASAGMLAKMSDALAFGSISL